MPTIHYTKKQFIKMIQGIPDDDHIILTTEVEGSLELKNKGKLKQVPFVFASDAFATPGTIGDLLATTLWGVILAPDSVVSKQFKHKKNNGKSK